MKTIIKDKNYSASILHFGAELESFTKDNTNYIWSVDEQFWNKTSPVLFPIVGGLKNNSYEIDGNEYELPRHGFARNFNFKVIETTENSVTFSLKENETTLQVYPFEFELQLKYVLNENKLSLIYSVENNSKNIMPFNIGAHPAFSIPSNFNEYSLHFNKEEKLLSHQLENDLFSGKTIGIQSKNQQLALNYTLFDKDALVFKNIESKEFELHFNNKPYIKISFSDFKHLGIWTKPNAPFLCIEPWMGYADKSNSNGKLFEKESIQTINPNEKLSCEFSIEIY
ncbi:aldose 1-epimerase family protein [Flavobacterium sp.]|uniref:aldose 1-epimerase family protein n=1 Tax=Flavobacterium sp. TaxID=239 RepID=UPI003F695DDB